MIKKDMPLIYKMQESLLNPWTENDFSTALMQSNAVGLIAETNGVFLGYMIYELYKPNFYISTLAIEETQRRKKIGTELVSLLLARLSMTRRRFVTMHVRENELSLQLFLKHLGFKAKLVRDYYEDEDAYYFSFKFKNGNI